MGTTLWQLCDQHDITTVPGFKQGRYKYGHDTTTKKM
jgi:hypothetical protein